MNALSRRSFMFASSGAAAGTFAVSGIVEAVEAGVGYSTSGLVTGQVKSLKQKEIAGFLFL